MKPEENYLFSVVIYLLLV